MAVQAVAISKSIHKSFLTEPVFRAAVHHTVTEAEAEIVHRLAQHGRSGPLGVEVGIAVGESGEKNTLPTLREQ